VVCNRASFVQDVTVPDNTAFDPNENFTKTWRLKNVGSCTWTSGYSLVFDSGDLMGGPASQQLTNGTVGPNQTIDVSVDLKAPANAGTYKGNWRLREPGGTLFALSTGPFWVQIKVQTEPAAQLPDWPNTQLGQSGPVVRALQHLLKEYGEDLDADGIFGPITKQRLQHFQSENGLAPDGIAGAQTWPQLIIQRQQGSTGQAVRAIQALLSLKYGYGVTVDGIFGPATDDAVRDFQDDHDLAVDGIVGPQTWRMPDRFVGRHCESEAPHTVTSHANNAPSQPKSSDGCRRLLLARSIRWPSSVFLVCPTPCHAQADGRPVRRQSCGHQRRSVVSFRSSCALLPRSRSCRGGPHPLRPSPCRQPGGSPARYQPI
jgi:hypothetical protein